MKVLNYSNIKVCLDFDRYHSHKCKSDLPSNPIVLLPKRPSVTVCLCALPLSIHTWWSTVTVTSQVCCAGLKSFKSCNSPIIFWECKCHVRCVKFCYLELFKKIAFASLYRPGHSDKPFAAPKQDQDTLWKTPQTLSSADNMRLLTDTIWQKWGRLLMVFGVCV